MQFKVNVNLQSFQTFTFFKQRLLMGQEVAKDTLVKMGSSNALETHFKQHSYCVFCSSKLQYTRFFLISNLGFCLGLGLLNSETETGPGNA